MRYIFCFSLLLLPIFIFSQIKITGKITDENNKILQGANIIVTETDKDVILTYSISNNKGVYSLNYNSKLDSLKVSVSYIGYVKQSKTISNKNQILNFKLLESSEKLKEVIIKSTPITKKGDTINYSVNAFKEHKDRVIADVLAKMPGIEVQNNGKILYQGKPIQKYYIEGLDLLEGKYNLANNNLPANSVSKVQILENHQPIKLLDSIVFSDKASLNIKLKNNITTTGTAKLGTGIGSFTPLWNVNITPMLFSKKQQMISSYKTNNVGYDISNEIKTLTIEDLLEQFESNNQKKDWVNILQLSPPPFSKKYWLNNNAHLLTTNYLIRLKKDLDLKINASYINDYQKQNGYTKTTFLTPNNTINITENTQNDLFFNSLQSKFIVTKNVNKEYLKNTFEIQKYWDSQNGEIILNDKKISQKTKIPHTSFSNKLKLIKPFGKKLITIKSVVSYSKSAQNLEVTPNKFKNLIKTNFNTLKQNIEHSNFYTNNHLSFTKGIKNFTFTPKIGFNIQNQKLNSHISTTENVLNNDDFQNNLTFNKSSFYTTLNTIYRNNSWVINFDIPLKYQSFKRVDNHLNKNETFNHFNFQPKLSIKKDLNAFWKTTFSASLKNTFGNINQLYYGYILNNYRNIQKYNTPISKVLGKNIAFRISYRNPIKALFINGFYSYSKSHHNLLFGNTIDENGVTSFGLFEKNNISNTHNINLRGSKYFSKLKSTLTLTSNISFSNKEQLLNKKYIDVKTKNIQFGGKLDTELSDWISIQYKNRFFIANTNFNNQHSFDNIVTQEHLLGFNLYPYTNQYFNINAEYYKNNLSNSHQKNYFLNLKYRYTLKKYNMDLEFICNNLFNTKHFTKVFIDDFSYSQSTYALRQRQFLVNLKFSF